MNRFLYWIFFDSSGLRSIWEKIFPPSDEKIKSDSYKKPSTFLLWTLGIYSAIFGIASQRYENRIDIIEIRATTILTQLPTDAYSSAIGRISKVQKLKAPYKPDFLWPPSVFYSLFSNSRFLEGSECSELVELLKNAVEDWKEFSPIC